ncbi:hypothetical protein Q7C36_003686 [Tachysurus vachellii]|uniref:Uncharacterized protein n=1 Tax=Tachysurus vachellii TaxID=175792 RepID=A0AA88NVF7_TACVA|nr:hypothetical protein Q7C36_003686 [Tachysurus vachellii]
MAISLCTIGGKRKKPKCDKCNVFRFVCLYFDGWISGSIKTNIWGYRWKRILYFRRHLTHFRWLYFSCVEIVFLRRHTGNLEELEQVIMAITVTTKPGASTTL